MDGIYLIANSRREILQYNVKLYVEVATVGAVA